MTMQHTPDDLQPVTTLNNSGGAAAALPADTLPLTEIDTSQWKLIREDRVMFEARSKASLDLRASKALSAKKPIKEDLTKKKSLRDIFSECM